MRRSRFCNSKWVVLGAVVVLVSLIISSWEAWALPPDYYEGGSGWDEGSLEAAFDPAARRGGDPAEGRYPGSLAQTSLGVRRDSLRGPEVTGNASFGITVPVVRLLGRGLDLALDLTYNSLLWLTGRDGIGFDRDGDWPAPGWSLGFGKIVFVSPKRGCMLIGADHTRHRYYEFVNWERLGERFTNRTTDGTFIDYECSVRFTESGQYQITRARAAYPNGTVVDYAAGGRPRELYPTRITDANGNYITITYLDDRGPRIATITDTVGRIIRFYYDSSSNLTAITGPGLEGTERPLVRLHYRSMDIMTGIGRAFYAGSEPIIRSSPVTLIDAIYFPGTSTGYWFGDGDSFSRYGMLAKVTEQRGMGFSATSFAEQGTVTAGRKTRQRVYNYPLTDDPSLRDAPTFTAMAETWEGMDEHPALTRDPALTREGDSLAAITRYELQPNNSPRQIKIILPDGSSKVQLSHNVSSNAQDRYRDGLTFAEMTYDSAQRLMIRTNTEWEPGDYGQSPRPRRIETVDELGQMTATEFGYGPAYNQVTEVREYDYGGTTMLRRTRTEYETQPGYVGRHIFNLPKTVEVFGGYETSPETRTEYTYDGRALVNAPGVVSHQAAFNPHAPRTWIPRVCERDCENGRNPRCVQMCEGGFWQTEYRRETDYRGNVTQIITYADARTRTGAVVEERRYDITGNMESVWGSCCLWESFEYTAASQYAYPTVHVLGAADPASPARATTRTTYDFNTGLPLTVTDYNGLTMRVSYDPASLRPREVWWPQTPGMNRTVYLYNDTSVALPTVTERVMSSDLLAVVSQNTTQFNGLGQVRRAGVWAEGDRWDIVEATYDPLGRLWQQTRPFRDGEIKQWSEWFYDALGRLTKLRAPDGSEMQNFYNEAVRPTAAAPRPGRTLRVVDAWGREHWSRINALGLLQEIIEPNADGGGSVFAPGHIGTYYTYNAQDLLVQVVQSPRPQGRMFRYDSLGRLTHQYLPEKLGTLNDAGEYRRPGSQWSDVFAYDDQSNLIAHIDARGVRTVFEYWNDPLNRLQAVVYETPNVWNVDDPILPAANVSYEYVSTGDLTRPRRVTAIGVNTEEFTYDAQGRLASTMLTLASRPNYPLVVDYVYDGTVDRLSDVRYPTEYGTPSTPRRLVHLDYGVGSRLKGLTFDGTPYASEIVYNAIGQVSSVKIGPAGNRQVSETQDYEPTTGFLKRQQVARAGTVLLDLSYGYLRPGRPGRTGQLTRVVDNIPRPVISDRPTLPSFQVLSYTYDSLGRLSGVAARYLAALRLGEPEPDPEPETEQIGRPDWAQHYRYDNYGNRTEVTVEQPPGRTLPRDGLAVLSFDTRTNRVANPGFLYDAAGNQTRRLRADGTWQRLQYDAAGRLARVVDDVDPILRDPIAEVYTYGPDRRRLITERRIYSPGVPTTGGPTLPGTGEAPTRLEARTYSVWNGNTVIAEYAETATSPQTPQWTRSYIYLGERLLSIREPGSDGVAVHNYHQDRLGIRLITSQVDEDFSENRTLPFGTLVAAGINPSARVFTSYERSPATGLDYAVNRYYDPQQGRFAQVDPLGIGPVDLTEPQSLNLYAYLRNDPVNAIDPLGLMGQLECDAKGYCVEKRDGVIIRAFGPDGEDLLAEEIVIVAPEPDEPDCIQCGKGLLPTGGPRERPDRGAGRGDGVPGAGDGGRGRVTDKVNANRKQDLQAEKMEQCLASIRHAYEQQLQEEMGKIRSSFTKEAVVIGGIATVVDPFIDKFFPPGKLYVKSVKAYAVVHGVVGNLLARDIAAWTMLSTNIQNVFENTRNPPCW